MLQTAYGSLAVGVRADRGESLLVRGGTSSSGWPWSCSPSARAHGLRHHPARAGARPAGAVGADHVLVDDGTVADQVRAIARAGWTARSS